MAEQDKSKPSEKEGKRAKEKPPPSKTQPENSGQTLTINEEKKSTSFIGDSSVDIKKNTLVENHMLFLQSYERYKNVSNHK